MRGLKFETIRRHPVGIICSNSSPLARQPAVRPSVVAMSELVVYRAREFPEYHQWVSRILRVSKGRLMIIQECAGEVAYHFDPFLYELSAQISTVADVGNTPTIDPSEIDTIVVPAREEGFQEVFLGENCWYAIRVHSSMIPKIRYIAAYQVAPVSAITYVAEVAAIEPWKDTQKYCVTFKEPAHKIGPIPLASSKKVAAPQSLRYTSFSRLQKASSLDDVF